MNLDLEKMKKRVLEIADPDNPYTQEDFNTEFSGVGVATIVPSTNDFRIKIPFVNQSTNEDPEFATEGASGFDFRANLSSGEELVINHGEIALIPTGLFFELPINYEIQVRPRSGLAAKYGVTVLNSPGTIDADYRGEVKVILINHGKEPFIVNHGDRIAQGVVAIVTAKNIIKLERVRNISDNTERSSGGFGSTGKN